MKTRRGWRDVRCDCCGRVIGRGVYEEWDLDETRSEGDFASMELDPGCEECEGDYYCAGCWEALKRDMQKKYFRTRSKDSLDDSRILERRVDDALAERRKRIEDKMNPQRGLFFGCEGDLR